MKYIDAEKLIVEIERRRDSALERQKNLEKIGQETVLNEMIAFELNRLISFVASLQQEQPEFNIPSAGSGAWGTTPPKFKLEVKEQPVEGLEEKGFVEEVRQYYSNNCTWDALKQPMLSIITRCARHFAEWGAKHSINWGDVQLLDTFILELSREEKDGADWGDSEKFYTEALRRFHEFNDKKIPEIVAEWEAEHLKKAE